MIRRCRERRAGPPGAHSPWSCTARRPRRSAISATSPAGRSTNRPTARDGRAGPRRSRPPAGGTYRGRAGMEIQADPVRPGLEAGQCLVDPGQAADLDPDGSAPGTGSLAGAIVGARTTERSASGSRHAELCQGGLELGLGLTPTRRSTSLPPWKTRTVGMAEIRRPPGVSWFSSVFILPILTLPVEFAGQLLDRRGQHAAGAAPGGPEIDHHGNRRIQDFRLPVGVGKLHHAPGHGWCLIDQRKSSGIDHDTQPYRRYAPRRPLNLEAL